MSRFYRINTIWRKELIDTLRDRRTVVAMVLVPMVLYPAMIIGLAQGKAIQEGMLAKEDYRIAVANDEAAAWLVDRIGSDRARRDAATRPTADRDGQPTPPRRPAEELVGEPPASQPSSRAVERMLARSARRSHAEQYYDDPPNMIVVVVHDVRAAVESGQVQAGVEFDGSPPPRDASGSTSVLILSDNTDVRSEPAVLGLIGVFDRLNDSMRDLRLGPGWRARINPLRIRQENVAPEEKQAGFVLGQIIPLILIIMTITGAIYPAIDLTAGERERGTLETLMVAPVPTVDLIAGKFVVVTLIGLMSAGLNLLSIGGTVYLGGLGELLAPGSETKLPLDALPWVLLMLVPLAVMFSAMLLAVCSFARSFKEAQNYIVPVMMAALIPGVVGILPATRFEGPIKIMPVANVVVLTRDLFLGKFDYAAIAWVVATTSLYAGCAVAIAAKLFGQEAVLFADAGSVKTLFQRRFFRPAAYPTMSAALLLVVVVYSLNFFVQASIQGSAALAEGMPFLRAMALTLVLLLAVAPWLACRYMRVDVKTAFGLHRPDPRALLAGLLMGGSTWILSLAWFQFQSTVMPFAPSISRLLEEQLAWMRQSDPWVIVFFLAVIPGTCEELFFRGYVLSGVRTSLRRFAAIFVVAFAFGVFHSDVYRLVNTTALGMLLGLLVYQYRSIWPAMLAHVLHNGLSLLTSHDQGLKPWITSLGFDAENPGTTWVLCAAAATGLGVLLCLAAPRRLRQPA